MQVDRLSLVAPISFPPGLLKDRAATGVQTQVVEQSHPMKVWIIVQHLKNLIVEQHRFFRVLKFDFIQHAEVIVIEEKQNVSCSSQSFRVAGELAMTGSCCYEIIRFSKTHLNRPCFSERSGAALCILILTKYTTNLMVSQTDLHTTFLARCAQLARLGAGSVAPNPMVGAVLVAGDKIIGEGWHRVYGQAHAEVNAVASVAAADRHLLRTATLYVSLEPCCIAGNTPACTDLIIREGIPRVVIGALDHTPGVDGKGIKHLQEAGVEVLQLNPYSDTDHPASIRNHFVRTGRPYIILKYAQSQDGLMGRHGQQVWITHPLTQRLVHKWRSEVSAIMVGTRTALVDNPALTNRHYFGPSPLRIVPDFQRRLHGNLQVLNTPPPTWVLTAPGDPRNNNTSARVRYLPVTDLQADLLPELSAAGYSSLMVEGGSLLLRTFLEAGLWDEVRILTGAGRLHTGIAAPVPVGTEVRRMQIGPDEVLLIKPLSEGAKR